MNLLVVCKKNNDLYNVLRENNVNFKHFPKISAAIESAEQSDALMILADGYPDVLTNVNQHVYEAINHKSLRLYIEFPSFLPDIEIGRVQKSKWERCVIASNAMEPDLEKMRILAIHGCHYVTMKSEKYHMAIAKVAGFDRATYGLPSQSHPILFEHPNGNILISSTKLSQFITARYAPYDALQAVLKWILNWLRPEEKIAALNWIPVVRPTYSPSEILPDDAEITAMRRCSQWFTNAKLFIHPDWNDADRRVDKLYDGNPPTEEILAPAPEKDWPIGDGAHGMIEGADATINPDGSQLWRYYLRSDCIGEASMAMALSGTLDDIQSNTQIAANLNDYLYFNSIFTKGPRAEKTSVSYGLITWSTNDPRGGVYYGDDNARCLLGTIAAGALLNEKKWDEKVLKCLLANLRTTGNYGFRGSRLEDEDIQKAGLSSMWRSNIINYAPHYESWIWACYLWAYHKTGFEPFLKKAKTAIQMMFDAYPDKWKWTNGIQQERARMLLPLAWLLRIEDTPQHRKWLRTITEDLLKNFDGCGAIYEELGILRNGRYAPPKSNEEYGTNEAPLIQENGDPLADLLYTMNFAFIGLHEAAKATNDIFYSKAEDKMAEFLCRIQIRSEAHPELDGAWFRAFDFKRWEYWASGADSGWGAWSIESGWTQTWIMSVLGFRRMNTSLWELTESSTIGRHSNKLITDMFNQDFF